MMIDAKDLISNMLAVNALARISISQVCTHHWMMEGYSMDPMEQYPGSNHLMIAKTTVLDELKSQELNCSEIEMAKEQSLTVSLRVDSKRPSRFATPEPSELESLYEFVPFSTILKSDSITRENSVDLDRIESENKLLPAARMKSFLGNLINWKDLKARKSLLTVSEK